MAHFQRKTPKSQQIYKSTYTYYNPHDIEIKSMEYDNIVRVISIDPGIRNYALRVEERSIQTSSYPIKTLVFEKLRISNKDRELSEISECMIYKLLSKFLDKYLKVFKTCHIIIIEKQMPFNYKATRIAQHTLTYFMTHLKNISTYPLIYEISAKLKGKELGASSHLNERGIKVWAVEKATELLELRKDENGLQILKKNKKKADDLADTVCQIEAFFSLNNWPLTQKVITLKNNNIVP